VDLGGFQFFFLSGLVLPC